MKFKLTYFYLSTTSHLVKNLFPKLFSSSNPSPTDDDVYERCLNLKFQPKAQFSLRPIQFTIQ